MNELDLEGLFGDPAAPYRDALGALFAQRKVLLHELKAKLDEISENNRQIAYRAMAVATYAGPGWLQRWLVKRAWRRIFHAHDIALMTVLNDLGPWVTAQNDFGAELRELTRLRYEAPEYPGQLDEPKIPNVRPGFVLK